MKQKKIKDKKIKDIKQEPVLENVLNGLQQSFKNSKGQTVKLKDILTDKEWWILKKQKSQMTIVLHDGVKKIADEAGILTNPRYNVMISPTHENNYTIAMQVEICDNSGRCSNEIGEVNRNNLGNRGRANPVNMAQKRAFDRAVFRHLGITGLLGEDELHDEEQEKDMDKLTNELQKEIVPFINMILNAKDIAELKTFNAQAKTPEFIALKPEQVDVLRGLWKKKFAELTKSF